MVAVLRRDSAHYVCLDTAPAPFGPTAPGLCPLTTVRRAAYGRALDGAEHRQSLIYKMVMRAPQTLRRSGHRPALLPG